MDRSGNVVTRAASNGGSFAWTVIFLDSQRVVHYDISFGNTYFNGHLSHVVLDRYDDGATSDDYLVGTITTTYNQ